MNSETIYLSVIICTYNRSRLAEKCIFSIINQDLPASDYEIIVVDNNSVDETPERIKQLAAKYPHLTYVLEENQGLSHARNAGCDAARGDYLTYLDDDALAPEGYLSHVFKTLKKYRPDIMSGPVFPYYETKKPRWFNDDYEIRKFAEESCFSTTCRVSGGNFTIRRDLLIELGKFDVNYGMKGDKIDLGEERAILENYRNSTDPDDQKVYYSVEAYVNHYVSPFKMKRRYMLKRYFQSGRAASRIKQKHPAGALRRMVAFIPDQAVFIWKEIHAKGPLKASYSKMLFNFALRVGNIAELLSHGWRPVLGPHIIDKYKRLRIFLKNRGLKKILHWVDARVKVNHLNTVEPNDKPNPPAKKSHPND